MPGAVTPKHIYPCEEHCVGCSKSSSCLKGPTELYMFDRTKDWIMIVGQGHGKIEEIKRRPFVGPSGKRLREIISHIWKQTGKFNIAFSNNVRFHPTDSSGKDRAPFDEEIDQCVIHLKNDVARIKPKLIFAAGMSATTTLIGMEDHSMAHIHGLSFTSDEFFGNRVVPIYHPSYVIRKAGREFDPLNPTNEDNLLIDDIIKGLYSVGVV